MQIPKLDHVTSVHRTLEGLLILFKVTAKVLTMPYMFCLLLYLSDFMSYSPHILFWTKPKSLLSLNKP